MSDILTRRSFLNQTSLAAGVGLATGTAVAASEEKKYKILGICCSPRKGKTTSAALEVCLQEAAKTSPQIQTELIELADLKIPAQVAAGVPLEEGERDDFPDLVPRIEAPEVRGLIIGTPVYFGNMSALCKAFLDRCIDFRKNDFSLSGKVAGVLAVGGNRNGGQELTIRSVQVALMSHQVLIVGDGLPTAHWGGTLWNQGGDDISTDELGLGTAKNLGKRVAEVILRHAV
jgi:multimeric flavodoxin WrbA